jgi:ribosomal protein S18 acetylase RimI-like enzyme
VLTPSRGLDSRSLAAIRALEAEVLAHDGGRLKLEHGVLETRDPEGVQDLLWWEGDRLVGFAGVYAFGGVEVAGMVAPDRRRQGIGSALLAAARELAGAPVLLVVPRGGGPGEAFARHHGGVLDHSEHFLVLRETPSGEPRDPAVTITRATDFNEVRRLLEAAFGWRPPKDLRDRDGDTTLLVQRDGVAVGTVRLTRHGDTAGVYGFAVDPSVQGQGIGRDVLGRVCRQLVDEGCVGVSLEVATDNERALGLYTSTGFVPEAGEDYWSL